MKMREYIFLWFFTDSKAETRGRIVYKMLIELVVQLAQKGKIVHDLSSTDRFFEYP